MRLEQVFAPEINLRKQCSWHSKVLMKACPLDTPEGWRLSPTACCSDVMGGGSVWIPWWIPSSEFLVLQVMFSPGLLLLLPYIGRFAASFEAQE